jgi:hypothetical protein
MSNLFFGQFLTWLPKIFLFIVFLIIVYLYIFRNKFISGKKSFFYKLSFLTPIGFGVFYAALLSFVQYFVWNSNKFTKILLNSADEKWNLFNYKFGYFLHYILLHFWLNVLISVCAGFLFYLFLIFLKKYRERFFEDGEVELGFALALIVGWPNFVVFIPLIFVFVIFISIFKALFLKQMYTTLGWPMIFAALVVLIWGDFLINVLKLGVLRI